jgi:hypothetical protein
MKMIIFLLILFAVQTSYAVNELPNPATHSAPFGDLPASKGDRVAPEPSAHRTLPQVFTTRENFYASVKAKLEEDDMRVDNLKLDAPDSKGPQLAKLDEGLKNLHDIVNNLSAVNDRELKPLERKVSSNFNSIEGNLSKIENEANKVK